ncbi:MAG: hypothetical protein WBC70_07295, partial [Candidatus Aminicenantales bacterium]
APLLVFDVGADPHGLRSVHAERPDLAAKYSKTLDRIWKEHRAMARKIGQPGRTGMRPEEAERLRTLGYIIE